MVWTTNDAELWLVFVVCILLTAAVVAFLVWFKLNRTSSGIVRLGSQAGGGIEQFDSLESAERRAGRRSEAWTTHAGGSNPKHSSATAISDTDIEATVEIEVNSGRTYQQEDRATRRDIQRPPLLIRMLNAMRTRRNRAHEFPADTRAALYRIFARKQISDTDIYIPNRESPLDVEFKGMMRSATDRINNPDHFSRPIQIVEFLTDKDSDTELLCHFCIKYEDLVCEFIQAFYGLCQPRPTRTWLILQVSKSLLV